VQYSHSGEEKIWNDIEDEYTMENYTTILFLFRRDGRDYREVTERQTYFAGVLHMPTDRLDEFYDNARAVINSLEFMEGAAITAELSELAISLGITRGCIFARVNGNNLHK